MRGISFSVAQGEIFGLLGPNGAGKSTTIGMLTTTIRPTSGTARLGGHDVDTAPLAARRSRASSSRTRCSTVPSADAATWRSTRGCGGSEPRLATKRITELCAALGLTDLVDRPPATYSGGERRRLEIARALVSRPQLLFLDEPTVGLDPRIRAELIDFIAGLGDRAETTILLTTHYLDEAERLCDRLAVLHEGRIVALDSPRALRARAGRTDRGASGAGRPGPGARPAPRATAGRARRIHRRLDRHGAAPRTRRAEAISGIERSGVQTTAMTTREPNLDDVYLRLTGGQLSAAA